MNHEHLSESDGVPISGPCNSLYEILAETAKQHAEDTAVVCLHQGGDRYEAVSGSCGSPYLKWTFTNLFRASHAFAVAMQAAGIRSGVRIVAFLPNCIEFHMLFLAALELNCCLAPVSPRSVGSAEEVRNIFEVIKPDIVVAEDLVLASKLEKLDSESSSRLRLRLLVNDDGSGKTLTGWQNMSTFMKPPAEGANALSISNIVRDKDDVVLVFMTSGTTSLPKGCPHTNRTLCSALRSFSWVACFDRSRAFCAQLPSSHMYGFLTTYTALMDGVPIVHPALYFDPGSTLKAIREQRCTDLAGVPAMMSALLAHPDFVKNDTAHLEFVTLGASTITVENLSSVVGDLGASKASDAYGLSEAAPVLVNRYDDLKAGLSVQVVAAPAAPGVRLRICDPNTGTTVPRSHPGELHVSGSVVMSEYWRASPKLDDDTFYRDDQGIWFRTGDQAIMLADGRVQIVGRYKDIIIRGGENISPRAIGDLLSRRFSLEAEICGIPDEIAGEVPVAILKRRKGQDVAESIVKQALVEELGPASALEAVIDVEVLGIQDFPRSTAGKVQKNILRQQVLDYLAQKSKQQITARLNGEQSLEELTKTLINVWTKLLGASEGSITAQTQMIEWADSLTMGRFPTLLQRETGKVMRLQNLMDNATPALQAKYLKSVGETSQVRSQQLFPSHDGPPTVQDMIHTHEDNERFEQTVRICKDVLKPLGLDWEDVQDVFPMYSYQQRFLTPRRLRSYNHRHAWLCTKSDVQATRVAVEAALSRHDILRTMAVMFDEQTPLLIAMRSGEKWYQNSITVLDQSVATATDLETIFFHDTTMDYAAFPGPLFRVVIAHVKDEDCAGIVYMGNHATFDAISLGYFLEDLDLLLKNPEEKQLHDSTPFKAYVSSAYDLRQSRSARNSVAWHVKRLTGMKAKRLALFPVQRAPEWFKGDHAGWIDPSTGQPGKRELRAGPHSVPAGVDGLSLRCALSDMQQLKQEHGIEPPCILKAALTMLNSRKTGQPCALFSQPQAARDWPFLPKWQEALMPPAMAVNGPTVEMVILKVDFEPHETTVLKLMRQLQDEQNLLNKHHHAPLDDIASALGKEEGDMLIDLTRRQIFNWLPTTSGSQFQRLKKLQLLSRADVGLQWNCMQLSNDAAMVMPSWDDAQLTLDEVTEMTKELIGIAETLAKKESWDTKLHEIISPLR